VLQASTKRDIIESAAKMVKIHTGKGPGNISLSMFNNNLILMFSQFLTPLESELAHKDHNYGLIYSIRNELIDCLSDEWRNLFGQHGLQIANINGAVDIANNQRVLVFTVEK